MNDRTQNGDTKSGFQSSVAADVSPRHFQKFAPTDGGGCGVLQFHLKKAVWGRSTRVPLIFAGPGIARDAKGGCPVELLDIFPTRLELNGFPARPDLEGHRRVPQLKDAKAPREWPAITTHNHDNHGIRTKRWRCLHYADRSEELYDLQADPNEGKNLAADPEFLAVKADLAKRLPKVNKQPVPGSAQRVLTCDPATGEVVWDGKQVGKNDPIPD